MSVKSQGPVNIRHDSLFHLSQATGKLISELPHEQSALALALEAEGVKHYEVQYLAHMLRRIENACVRAMHVSSRRAQ